MLKEIAIDCSISIQFVVFLEINRKAPSLDDQNNLAISLLCIILVLGKF